MMHFEPVLGEIALVFGIEVDDHHTAALGLAWPTAAAVPTTEAPFCQGRNAVLGATFVVSRPSTLFSHMMVR